MFSGLFIRKQKGTWIFQWQENINVVVIGALSSTKLCLFFEILISSQDTWGKVHYVPKINLISQGTPIKSFYLPSKINYNKSETRFCWQKTTEDNNAKINVSPNTPSTFFLFKTGAFFQKIFQKSLLFWQILRTSVFLNSKCLTLLYLFPY